MLWFHGMIKNFGPEESDFYQNLQSHCEEEDKSRDKTAVELTWDAII